MGGRYCRHTGSPGGRGASWGGMLQMEKSGVVRPGGGGMYPGIPPMEVLRSVTPLEEEVTPYLQPAGQSGSMTWGELAERLPYMYSEVSGDNSGNKTLLL